MIPDAMKKKVDPYIDALTDHWSANFNHPDDFYKILNIYHQLLLSEPCEFDSQSAKKYWRNSGGDTSAFEQGARWQFDQTKAAMVAMRLQLELMQNTAEGLTGKNEELESVAKELFEQLGWMNRKIKVCASTNIVLRGAVNIFKKFKIKYK